MDPRKRTSNTQSDGPSNCDTFRHEWTPNFPELKDVIIIDLDEDPKDELNPSVRTQTLPGRGTDQQNLYGARASSVTALPPQDRHASPRSLQQTMINGDRDSASPRVLTSPGRVHKSTSQAEGRHSRQKNVHPYARPRSQMPLEDPPVDVPLQSQEPAQEFIIPYDVTSYPIWNSFMELEDELYWANWAANHSDTKVVGSPDNAPRLNTSSRLVVRLINKGPPAAEDKI